MGGLMGAVPRALPQKSAMLRKMFGDAEAAPKEDPEKTMATKMVVVIHPVRRHLGDLEVALL